MRHLNDLELHSEHGLNYGYDLDKEGGSGEMIAVLREPESYQLFEEFEYGGIVWEVRSKSLQSDVRGDKLYMIRAHAICLWDGNKPFRQHVKEAVERSINENAHSHHNLQEK